MFPETPELGILRPATIQDVPRMAAVAVAGFYYSPSFMLVRPHHKTYPEDTFQAFERKLAAEVRDPEYITLVAEDSYQNDEGSKTDAAIKPGVGYVVPKSGDSVIVAVGTWKLEPGSARKGQFMDRGDMASLERRVFGGGLGRDRGSPPRKLLEEDRAAEDERLYGGHPLKGWVVTHPAYWRRGHGPKLVSWGMALADNDQIKLGLLAATMGEKLYSSLDYTKLGSRKAQDDEGKSKNRIEWGVVKYIPKPIPKTSVETVASTSTS